MVVLGGFLLTIIIGGVNRSYGVFYIEVLERFGSSYALSAWLGGLQTFFRLSLSPFAAALCSRFNVQRVVMAGGLLYGLGLFLSAWVESLGLLYITYGILTGLGGTLVYTPSYIILSQYFEKRLGIALSFMSCGAGVGNFFWPPLLHLSLQRLSYFETLSTFSGVTFHLVAIGALYYELPKEAEEEKKEMESDAEKSQSTTGVMSRTCLKHFNLVVLRDANALLFYFAVLMYMFGAFSFSNLIVDFAQDRGVSADLTPFLLSFEGLSQFVIRFSSGFIFDSKLCRPHRLQIWSAAFLIVAFLAVSAVFCWSFAAFGVCVFVFACCKGLIISQMVTVLKDIVRKEHLASAIGYTGLARGLGVFVGSVLCGYLKDLSDSYVLSYVAMSSIVLVASVTLGVLNMRILRRKRREREERGEEEEEAVL